MEWDTHYAPDINLEIFIYLKLKKKYFLYIFLYINRFWQSRIVALFLVCSKQTIWVFLLKKMVWSFSRRIAIFSTARRPRKIYLNYSTLSNKDNLKLDPWLITGFADGEGSFSVSGHPFSPLLKLRRGEKGISENKNSKLGLTVQPRFTIGLHKKDKPLLQKIQSSLGIGKIYEQGSQLNQFRVESLKEVELVLKHFQKYPLFTKKRADFLLLMQVIEVMERR